MVGQLMDNDNGTNERNESGVGSKTIYIYALSGSRRDDMNGATGLATYIHTALGIFGEWGPTLCHKMGRRDK